MHEEIVTYNSSGHRLVGVLSHPDKPAKRGVVIVHGWGGYRAGTHNMMVKLARHLANNNLHVLRFDLRGRGDSDGTSNNTSLDDMIADTLRTGEELARRTEISTLSVIGHCSGGNCALGTVIQDARYDKVVPISTFPFQEQMTSAHSAAHRRNRWLTALGRIFHKGTWSKLRSGRLQWRKILKNLRAGEDRPQNPQGHNLKQSKLDIPNALAQWTGRGLFLYGGADAEDSASLKFYKAFNQQHNLRFSFDEVAGANHNFYALEWESMLFKKIADFLI